MSAATASPDHQPRQAARTLAGVVLALLLSGCIRLDRTDMFPVAGAPVRLSALQALVPQGAVVRRVDMDGSVDAYEVRQPNARGVVMLFGGSGNEIAAPIVNFSKHLPALKLDLVVFSYYRQGEPVPSVTQMRARAQAVQAAVQRLEPGLKLYLVGYSLGGWFAMDAGAGSACTGVMLVGAETTPAEVIRRTYAPWSAALSIRPDADVRQLDAALYAPRMQVPTLVVTSAQDEAVPEAVGREVYALLPPATEKSLLVLHGYTHGRYFLSKTLWTTFGRFFRLDQN